MPHEETAMPQYTGSAGGRVAGPAPYDAYEAQRRAEQWAMLQQLTISMNIRIGTASVNIERCIPITDDSTVALQHWDHLIAEPVKAMVASLLTQHFTQLAYAMNGTGDLTHVAP